MQTAQSLSHRGAVPNLKLNKVSDLSAIFENTLSAGNGGCHFKNPLSSVRADFNNNIFVSLLVILKSLLS
jgi:hypothetical protein